MDYIKIYDNVWTPEECLHFISLIEGSERKAGIHWGVDGEPISNEDIKSSEDVCISYDYPDEVHDILTRMGKIVDQYSQDIGIPRIPVYQTEPINGRVYRKNKGKYVTHMDVASQHTMGRSLAILVYLNDITEGGELYFPKQDVTVIPKAGRVVVFPPYWTHLHEAKIPLSDDRYILRIFGTLNL